MRPTLKMCVYIAFEIPTFWFIWWLIGFEATVVTALALLCARGDFDFSNVVEKKQELKKEKEN